MARLQHVVRLSAANRSTLQTLISTGTRPALTTKRARILLVCDATRPGRRLSDRQVAEQVACSARTVARTRATWTARGMETVIRKVRATPPVPAKLGSAQALQILAIARSEPPAGYTRWSLRMLARRAVELEIVSSIVPETIRTTLNKTISP